MTKLLSLDGLKRYTENMMKYIDERIAEHNKVIILKECPCCGAHEFKIGNHLYECTYCGSKFYYQTFYDKEQIEAISKNIK